MVFGEDQFWSSKRNRPAQIHDCNTVPLYYELKMLIESEKIFSNNLIAFEPSSMSLTRCIPVKTTWTKVVGS